MLGRTIRVTPLLTLTIVLGLGTTILYGQLSEPAAQSFTADSPKAEDWSGQIRAYAEFAGQLGGEDYRAQQDPDRAQIYRPDYHTIIGLSLDEVGALWSTLVAADANCKKLDSGVYAKYPRLTPDQEREQAAKPDAATLLEEKHRALADVRSKKRQAISNAIAELKLQLGHDEFLRLDSWVRDQYGPKGSGHRRNARRP